MAEEEVVYTCEVCGYINTWTRDEVLRKGQRVIYRGEDEDIFSLPCKNPARPTCRGRHKVAVTRGEG